MPTTHHAAQGQLHPAQGQVPLVSSAFCLPRYIDVNTACARIYSHPEVDKFPNLLAKFICQFVFFMPLPSCYLMHYIVRASV